MLEQTAQEIVESSSLDVFKRCVDGVFRFSGRLGSARLVVGLDDLRGIFQPKWF